MTRGPTMSARLIAATSGTASSGFRERTTTGLGSDAANSDEVSDDVHRFVPGVPAWRGLSSLVTHCIALGRGEMLPTAASATDAEQARVPAFGAGQSAFLGVCTVGFRPRRHRGRTYRPG